MCGLGSCLEIGINYPRINADHVIISIGAEMLFWMRDCLAFVQFHLADTRYVALPHVLCAPYYG